MWVSEQVGKINPSPEIGRGEIFQDALSNAGLLVFLAEILHEIGQKLDAFDGHGVVDRRAATADGTMALQLLQAAFGRLLQERFVVGRIGQSERHIHHRPSGSIRMSLVETVRLVDHIVE